MYSRNPPMPKEVRVAVFHGLHAFLGPDRCGGSHAGANDVELRQGGVWALAGGKPEMAQGGATPDHNTRFYYFTHLASPALALIRRENILHTPAVTPQHRVRGSYVLAPGPSRAVPRAVLPRTVSTGT
jgi:hypothetical protein